MVADSTEMSSQSGKEIAYNCGNLYKECSTSESPTFVWCYLSLVYTISILCATMLLVRTISSEKEYIHFYHGYPSLGHILTRNPENMSRILTRKMMFAQSAWKNLINQNSKSKSWTPTQSFNSNAVPSICFTPNASKSGLTKRISVRCVGSLFCSNLIIVVQGAIK